MAAVYISNDALLLDFGGHVLRTADLRATARNNSAVSFLLTVPGKITRPYRGRIVLKATRGEVVPIITMDLETSVASAVAADSDSDAPPQALESQAVVARSEFLTRGS